MPEYLSILILFFVGLAAGIINVNAGGGSTLTLPTLIFLGLDSAVANGTNRIAIFLQNIIAIQSFKKKNFHQFNLSWKLSLLTLPGAVAGAFISTKVEDKTFQLILGLIMIGIVLSMLIPRKTIEISNEKDKKISISVILAMTGIGFYGGFIQVGVGFLLMSALYNLLKFDLIFVNMHKVFIIFIYTIPALLIFILTDNVNWFFGLSLAAGNSLGAKVGVKFAVERGENFIKSILVVAVIIMALKLLGVF